MQARFIFNHFIIKYDTTVIFNDNNTIFHILFCILSASFHA